MADPINTGPINTGTMAGLFGIHGTALGIREARLNVLASNLANTDTPNYKARDIDFATALQNATAAAQSPLSTAADKNSGTLVSPVDLESAMRYRVPLQPSLDGNTVDSDFEHAAFSRAALEYKASLSFVDARVHTMMTAITGE